MENPYIEPCCYEKWIGVLLEELKSTGGVGCFFTNSDWNESQLLHYLAGRFQQRDLYLTFVQIESETAYAIRDVMNRMTVDVQTKKNVPLISRIHILMRGTDVNRNSVRDALRGISIDRYVISEDRIGFRSILLCNSEGEGCLMQGSINQLNGSDTQMIDVSIRKDMIAKVRGLLDSKERVHKVALMGD